MNEMVIFVVNFEVGFLQINIQLYTLALFSSLKTSNFSLKNVRIISKTISIVKQHCNLTFSKNNFWHTFIVQNCTYNPEFKVILEVRW